MYLKNLKDTGAKEKKTFKCTVCDFEGVDEKLMRGHMSLHQPGSGNYENGILSHKDGYSCNKCGEITKTMGLIRRHMKTKHGINIIPTEDGARSLLSQSSFRIKCD